MNTLLEFELTFCRFELKKEVDPVKLNKLNLQTNIYQDADGAA